MDGEAPREFVCRIAMDKADAVVAAVADVEGAGDRIVLAADTIVFIDGEILGKPRDLRHATSMLRRLSGGVHDVLTGVAVVCGTARRNVVETTRVSLVELAESTIDWYLSTGEANDKAGAYGVQGVASRFVDRIDGSYTNVVGLPMARVDQLLREFDHR